MSIQLKKVASLAALVIVGLLISSCTLAGDKAPNEVELPAATVQPGEVPTRAAEDNPTETATSQPAMTATMEQADTESQDSAPLPDQGPIPTGSSLLKSTDPETVDLANGEPKLVEFFAFW